MKHWKWSMALGLALVSACVSRPPPAVSENAAVRALVEASQVDADAGRLPNAAATLERALRIEPRNARLWHELARVRLSQGEYPQAEAIAIRSNSFAGTDARLRASNWQLISDSRRARGDEPGADEAQRRAR